MILNLILGIKRSRFRDNDARRGRADAEFAAKRPNVLSKAAWTCAGCSYVSKAARGLDVHHVDDDHHNNADSNLAPACHTCHPYQHVGELVRRTDIPGEGLGNASVIAAVPEISAKDLNLLQRAIGMALLDEKEAPVARAMIKAFATRAEHVQAVFGTHRPADFAAAMAALSDDEYAARDDAVAALRLLYNEPNLRKLGTQMQQDYPAMPLSSWEAVSQAVLKRKSSQGAQG